MTPSIRAGMVALILALWATPTMAQDDIWTKLINKDSTTVWNVQPDKPKAKDVAAPSIPGEWALRVKGRKAANPWDVQAMTPVQGDIATGDQVLISFFARAEKAAEGGSRLPIRMQINTPPYSAVIQTERLVTSEWKQYCAHAVAETDFKGGSTMLAVHLGNADQVIDLGPVFVFNLGKGFDRKKLPEC